MLIQDKIGNLANYEPADRTIDWLPLEWFETSKRILSKRTRAGKEVTLKFLNRNPGHSEGDILIAGTFHIIAIEIIPCNCIVMLPGSMQEMAALCYEIGNKHLPLFFEQGQLLVPFDNPLYKLLRGQGYNVKQENRKLLNPLKTTVPAHGGSGGESLFTKIMNLKTPAS